MEYKYKSFGNPKSYDENDFLSVALGVYKWIESNRIDGKDGTYYRVNPGSLIEYDEHAVHSKRGLYSGSSGIGLFLIRLFQITGDKKYLDEADQIYLDLVENHNGSDFYFDKLKTAIESELKVIGWHTGVYTGPSGAGVFALEMYKIKSDNKYLELAKKVAEDILEASTVTDEGLTLTKDIDVFSDGGFVLYFISLYKVTKQKKYLDIARDFAKYIYSQAEKSEDGGVYFHANDLSKVGMPEDSIYPGFSHGTAGIGFIFATLYEEDKQEWELSAATLSAKFLTDISDKYDEGRLIPYIYGPNTGEEYDRKYYIGFCHGPAGTALLFRKLYEITKDEKYKQIVSELAEGIIVAGAPKYNSWGFWNSNCTCCGAPGLIEFFAEMYEFFAEDKYLRYARDAAARVIGDLFMTSEGRVHYGSWDRTNPKAIESFTGLYTGAAGAGASLLKLYSVLMNEKIEPLWEYSYL